MVALRHSTYHDNICSQRKGKIFQNHLGTWHLLILLSVNSVFIQINVYSFLTFSFEGPDKRRSHTWDHHNTSIHCELLFFYFQRHCNKKEVFVDMQKANNSSGLAGHSADMHMASAAGHWPWCGQWMEAECSPELQQRLWVHCSVKLGPEPCQKINDPD